jgi:cation diffusion facilitator CzcD-associated flavoprotein CzcO
VETVVIGAGHAGLAAGWALAENGAEHVVLEEGRIGQTWRDDRWDSFRLNTARWMSRLPGHDLSGSDADGFDTAPEFVSAPGRRPHVPPRGRGEHRAGEGGARRVGPARRSLRRR